MTSPEELADECYRALPLDEYGEKAQTDIILRFIRKAKVETWDEAIEVVQAQLVAASLSEEIRRDPKTILDRRESLQYQKIVAYLSRAQADAIEKECES